MVEENSNNAQRDANTKGEPHDSAFLWNMYGLVWTHRNKPELIDLPFEEVSVNE